MGLYKVKITEVRTMSKYYDTDYDFEALTQAHKEYMEGDYMDDADVEVHIELIEENGDE